MKIAIGLLLAVCVGIGCRWFGIPLPGPPLSLALSADGKTAYLGIQDSDKIVVISVPEKKIIRVFDTPPGSLKEDMSRRTGA